MVASEKEKTTGREREKMSSSQRLSTNFPHYYIKNCVHKQHERHVVRVILRGTYV